MSLSREDELVEELQPFIDADPEGGRDVRALLAGVAAMAEPVSSIIRDSDAGPGWSALVSPTRCPAEWLPYPAQIVGVDLPAGLSEADQRVLIQAQPGLVRGSLTAQIVAAQLTLTGTRTIIPQERYGSAWRQRFITRPGETPDAAKTLAALQSQKPIGMIIVHDIFDGITWADLAARSGGTWTWQDTLDHFTTWGDVRLNNSH